MIAEPALRALDLDPDGPGATEELLAAQCVIRHAHSAEEAAMLHAMLGLQAPAFGGDWTLAARIHALARKVVKP